MSEPAFTFSLPSVKKKAVPPILVIHGDVGTGKTSLVASAPNVLMMFTENGQRDLSVRTIKDTPFENYDEFVAGLTYIGIGIKKGDFKVDTLGIDSLDHLEQLVLQKVADHFKLRADAENVNFVGTGFSDIPDKYNFDKWSQITTYWSKIWNLILRIRELGVAIVGICHSVITKVENPDLETEFDRYDLKLDPKRAQHFWIDNADAIGFVRYVTLKNGDKKQLIVEKHPTITFENNPAWRTKRNFGLTKTMLSKPETGFMDTFGSIPYYSGTVETNKSKKETK